MESQELSLCRLRVVADADPGSLARILERLQNINCLPRRVNAELGANEILHVEVDIVGLLAEQLTLMVAKIVQAPCIVSAYWHWL